MSQDSAPTPYALEPFLSHPLVVGGDGITFFLRYVQVRTSALNITLHIFSMKDPGVKAFLAREENHGGFFAQLSRLLQDAYSQILCRVSGGAPGSESLPMCQDARENVSERFALCPAKVCLGRVDHIFSRSSSDQKTKRNEIQMRAILEDSIPTLRAAAWCRGWRWRRVRGDRSDCSLPRTYTSALLAPLNEAVGDRRAWGVAVMFGW